MSQVRKPIEDKTDDNTEIKTLRKDDEEKKELHEGINFVVLVTEEKEKRYGQIAALFSHDFKESGMYHVRFKDDKWERYYDGKMKGDPPSHVKVFYRKNDEKNKEYESYNWGLKDFKVAYFELNVGDIEKLRKEFHDLFGEELP